MALLIIKIAVCIVAGFFAGPAAAFVFNKMPAKWLCDYGETPSQELEDPYVKRIRENPWRWVYAAAFICLCLRLCFSVDIQLAAAGLTVCWLLLIIALADMKYMIIPDQFVILLALSAIGFAPFYKTGIGVELTGITGIMQPLLGMIAGGGFMLAVAGAGAVLTRREAVGFGDVKLCAAIGLVLGLPGIAATLVMGLISSGVFAAAGLVCGRLKKDSAIAMGPFLCGSAMAYIFVCLPFIV